MLLVQDADLLREENRRLKDMIDERDEEIRQLRQALRPPDWSPPIELRLTPQESRLLATMYKARGEVSSKERLYYALYHDQHDQRELKIIDTHVCKMRKKLLAYDIHIETLWGQGYRIDTSSVKILDSWDLTVD